MIVRKKQKARRTLTRIIPILSPDFAGADVSIETAADIGTSATAAAALETNNSSTS